MTIPRSARAILLLLLCGCQTPPAQLAGCSPPTANRSRDRVLLRQILCDTGEELVHHPLRAGRTVFADQIAWFGSVGRGIFGKRIGMRLHGTPPPLCLCACEGNPELSETGLQPAAVQMYRDGHTALAVLEQLIDSAQCRIDVIMYVWEEDAVGFSIAQRLAAAAAAKRRVRVLVDGGANLIFAPTPGTDSPPGSITPRSEKPKTAGEVNRAVCWLAQQPGVELIRIRNPLAHFDHRKLVLIDGQCAWAGGRNFTGPAFFVRHDFSLTVQGPLVADWQNLFESYWRDQGGKPVGWAARPTSGVRWASRPTLQSDTSSVGWAESSRPTLQSDTFSVGWAESSRPTRGAVGLEDSAHPTSMANAAARLVASGPTEHSLRTALYHAIDQARCSIYLENPYLTDNGVIVKLARARRRGVDVRILFTIQSDSSSINHTNKATANRFLAAGVRVYLYPGRVHTKAALIDGTWAYMGSGNFDLLSLHRNHELGIVFGPCPFLAELEQILFQPDFNPEWELRAPLPLTAADRAYEMLAAFFL